MQQETGSKMLQQFLRTSRDYLTRPAAEVEQPDSNRRSTARALLRSPSLRRPSDRRDAQPDGIRTFAGRHRFP